MTGAAATLAMVRILVVGDSIARGTYTDHYPNGQAIGLPRPGGGGWRAHLQARLREANIRHEFVGDLTMGGSSDPLFQPRHHGCAGFSAGDLALGGEVPTPADVLDAMGARMITVEPLRKVAKRLRPDVVLLMAGTNGLQSHAVEQLAVEAMVVCRCHVIVGLIPYQRPPLGRYTPRQVDDFNARLRSFAFTVPELDIADIGAAVGEDGLADDGVHLSRVGEERAAGVWFAAIARARR